MVLLAHRTVYTCFCLRACTQNRLNLDLLAHKTVLTWFCLHTESFKRASACMLAHRIVKHSSACTQNGHCNSACTQNCSCDSACTQNCYRGCACIQNCLNLVLLAHKELPFQAFCVTRAQHLSCSVCKFACHLLKRDVFTQNLPSPQT